MAKPPAKKSSAGEIAGFLKQSRNIQAFVAKQPRLIFAIDATASRQPTWDRAVHLQRDMFLATRELAALSVQLCYYRGLADFRASPWIGDPERLADEMSRVFCEGGHTQIARLLRHAVGQHREKPLRALIFVGDAMEENAGTLVDLAAQCGLLKLPLFLFQEGRLPDVETTFKDMARLSGGAWARFDSASADSLRQLLGAVARYAAGGREALENQNSRSVKLLLEQLDR
ncbi:MAG: VWA domain-containing protein [Pseudomonadota bacterium]